VVLSLFNLVSSPVDLKDELPIPDVGHDVLEDVSAVHMREVDAEGDPIFADHPLSHGYAEAGITNSMQESGDLPLAGHTAGERGGEKSSRLLPAR